MDALLGTLILNNTAAPRVQFTEMHFPGTFNYTVNDLCALKLSRPTDELGLSPLDLAPTRIGYVSEYDNFEMPAVIAGFGRTRESQPVASPDLRYALSVYRSNKYCVDSVAQNAKALYDNASILCTQEYCKRNLFLFRFVSF